MTPDRRARNTLFGEHFDNEPIKSHGFFLHPGTLEQITFKALVARYEDEEDAASHD
jgi:hypothetical protein